MKNLTIIIVTYNSSSIIINCLNKINYNLYNVIIVDNASTDNTVFIIESNFPSLKIIKNNKNIGYGRANNIALRKVETEFAMVLNPDAFIFEKEIDFIISSLQAEKEIAIGAPLLLSSYPPTELDIAKQNSIVESNLIEKTNQYMSVKYIIGALLFLRMSAFKKIGFFDENIFLYYEDDEICFRAINNGYKLAIFNSVFGFHIGSGSSSYNPRVVYKRFWHRALSKLYWKEKSKSKFVAIKSAIRLSVTFFIKAIFYSLILKKYDAVKNFASFCGSFAFILRLKAFDKNDNPRA